MSSPTLATDIGPQKAIFLSYYTLYPCKTNCVRAYYHVDVVSIQRPQGNTYLLCLTIVICIGIGVMHSFHDYPPSLAHNIVHVRLASYMLWDHYYTTGSKYWLDRDLIIQPGAIPIGSPPHHDDDKQ